MSLMPAQVGDGVFEVLSTAGDTHLGGDDFDKRIVDFLADDFKKSEGIDLRKDRQVWLRTGHQEFASICGWCEEGHGSSVFASSHSCIVAMN